MDTLDQKKFVYEKINNSQWVILTENLRKNWAPYLKKPNIILDLLWVMAPNNKNFKNLAQMLSKHFWKINRKNLHIFVEFWKKKFKFPSQFSRENSHRASQKLFWLSKVNRYDKLFLMIIYDEEKGWFFCPIKYNWQRGWCKMLKQQNLSYRLTS